MLALLHYFWEQARLNRWYPAMEGKRNWGVVRTALLRAAENTFSKGENLSTVLYIPEPWNEGIKDSLLQRRLTLFRTISRRVGSGQSPFILAIGELKFLAPHGNSIRLMLKHAPDAVFLVPGDLYKRVVKRFESVLRSRESEEGFHIVAMATLSVDHVRDHELSRLRRADVVGPSSLTKTIVISMVI